MKRRRAVKVPRTEAEKAIQREKRKVNKAKEQARLTRLLRALLEAGVPITGFVRQYPFFGPWKTSHPWAIDLADPRLLIAIEIDGGSWSGKPCQLCGERPGGRHSHGGREAERLKLNTLAACGWRVCAFTSEAIDRKLPECVRIIAEMFRWRVEPVPE